MPEPSRRSRRDSPGSANGFRAFACGPAATLPQWRARSDGGPQAGDEAGPLVLADDEGGSVRVLGVADGDDAGQVAGNLYAVAAAAVAAGGLAPHGTRQVGVHLAPPL